MSAPILILLVTAAVVVGLSVLFALAMGKTPPIQGFWKDFTGGLIVFGALAIVGEGLVFGAIRLVRYAWGSP